jgi:hypothetical protein
MPTSNGRVCLVGFITAVGAGGLLGALFDGTGDPTGRVLSGILAFALLEVAAVLAVGLFWFDRLPPNVRHAVQVLVAAHPPRPTAFADEFEDVDDED